MPDKKVEEFFSRRIDEFKVDMGKRVQELSFMPDNQLILAALFEIMCEQERTGHRSEGWPSRDHNAIRFMLHHRSEG